MKMDNFDVTPYVLNLTKPIFMLWIANHYYAKLIY